MALSRLQFWGKVAACRMGRLESVRPEIALYQQQLCEDGCRPAFIGKAVAVPSAGLQRITRAGKACTGAHTSAAARASASRSRSRSLTAAPVDTTTDWPRSAVKSRPARSACTRMVAKFKIPSWSGCT